MDPDGFFIILLFLFLGILLIVNVIGLARKTVTIRDPFLKWFLFLMIIFFPFWAIPLFVNSISNIWLIILPYIACGLIGLNWSLNLVRKRWLNRPRSFRVMTTILFTAFFTVLIPFLFHQLGNFFEWLDLLGNNE